MSMLQFPQSYILACALVVFFLACKFILYPVFLSPLSQIPVAHPLASVTSLWIQWQRLRNREFQSISAAFASKGPYVRLGPSEIAVNTIEGVFNVYGVGTNNFDKHESYEYFITHGVRNMFSSLGKDHAIRKRQISGVYSRSFVQSSPHFREILRTVLLQRMLPLLDQAASSKRGIVDLLPLLQSYALDFMSSFMFGLPRGYNFIQDERARQHWFDLYIRSYPADGMFWLLEHPLLAKILCAFGIPLLPKGHAEAKHEYETSASRQVEEAEKALIESRDSGIPLPHGEFPILYECVRSGIAKDAGISKNFTPDLRQLHELASECFDHLVATRDTFGTSFTYVIYEISRHPEAQDELRRELLSIDTPSRYCSSIPAEEAMPAPAALANLPFLNAVIKEGLRLRNNTPGMDPRMTPANRRSSVGPWHNLPPGVRVGAFAWCLHRNGDVYPDPTKWSPQRWLDDGNKKSASRDRWFFAFSGGSRGCIGQQVAMELMRYAVAAIYSNFKTSVADESAYPGTEGVVGGDCKEKLFIRFEPLRA